MSGTSKKAYLHSVHDQVFQLIDIVHVLGTQLGKLLCEKRLLVLADAALHVRINDSLQPHGKWIQIPLRLNRVHRDQVSQLLLGRLHSFARILHRGDLLGAPIDDFEAAQYSRQCTFGFQDGTLDPQRFDLVVLVDDAFVYGSVALEAAHVVVVIVARDLFGNVVGGQHDRVLLGDWLYVAYLNNCDSS